ncbi:hypothetical protein BX616_004451, partial [Lobosporangium transversale]
MLIEPIASVIRKNGKALEAQEHGDEKEKEVEVEEKVSMLERSMGNIRSTTISNKKGDPIFCEHVMVTLIPGCLVHSSLVYATDDLRPWKRELSSCRELLSEVEPRSIEVQDIPSISGTQS